MTTSRLTMATTTLIIEKTESMQISNCMQVAGKTYRTITVRHAGGVFDIELVTAPDQDTIKVEIN